MSGRLQPRRSVPLVALAFVAIPIVGWLDAKSSAFIAFSVFYVIPILGAAWFGNHATAAIAAFGSAVSGLLADISTMGLAHGYAYVNLGARLTLFLTLAYLFSRHARRFEEERRLGALQRDIADRERQLRETQTALMRTVSTESMEPLSQICAKVLEIGFDRDDLSPDELRTLLSDLAQASTRVSRSIAKLDESSVATTA